jgi:hypothetical protein
MRQRRLGERLRALILATPLIGVPACSTGGYCDYPDAAAVFSLTPSGDAGIGGTPCFPGCSDGGYVCNGLCGDCHRTCEFLIPTLPGLSNRGSPDILDCVLLTLPDGGPGLNCAWVEACPGGRRPASLLSPREEPRVRVWSPGLMWRPKVGPTLRAIALARQLFGIPGCGSTPTCNGRDGGVCAVTRDSGWGSDAGDCLTACGCVATGPFSTDTCSFLTLPDGGPGVSCAGPQLCAGGRRPVALLAMNRFERAHPVGRYFSEAARLEAASIPAFQVLTRELRARRAPVALVSAAMCAVQDEVRHRRATAALARRYGAEPIRPSFGPTPVDRTLEAIATENAVEGCVRETYGALVALWQARHARDPVVAAAMAPIAADETRHAELAWEVAAWAEPSLSEVARGCINAARAQALADLTSEASRPVPPSLVAFAGLPPPETAVALLNALALELEPAAS